MKRVSESPLPAPKRVKAESVEIEGIASWCIGKKFTPRERKTMSIFAVLKGKSWLFITEQLHTPQVIPFSTLDTTSMQVSVTDEVFLSRLNMYAERIDDLVQRDARRIVRSDTARVKYPYVKPAKSKEDGTMYPPLVSFNLKKATILVTGREDAVNLETEDLRGYFVKELTFQHRLYVTRKGEYIMSRQVSKMLLDPPIPRDNGPSIL